MKKKQQKPDYVYIIFSFTKAENEKHMEIVFEQKLTWILIPKLQIN